jgi:hypothetical protein
LTYDRRPLLIALRARRTTYAKGAWFLIARSSPAAFTPTRDVGRMPIDVFIDVFVDIDVLVDVDIDTTRPFIPAQTVPVARRMSVTAA